MGEAAKGSVTYQQLTVDAKKVVRDKWKKDHPEMNPQTDAQIDQAITGAGGQYTADGTPV